jgi:hypothetical protein
MSYFKQFPTINYTFDTSQTVVAFNIADFTRRVTAEDANLATTLAYDEYDILDGETPEIVSDRLYNNPQYHWIILIANGITDPRFDWPLSVNAFNSYVAGKYANIGAVHHYVNNDGDTVHASYAGAKTAISNYDYELAINESKRRIRIVKPEFIPMFTKNFYGTLNNG